ncbi:MAG: biotin/lipoyl-containing protein [Chitinophagales bacterium]
MNKATVNNNFSFDIEQNRDELFINGEKTEACIQKIAEGSYHVILDYRSYNAELESVDTEEKSFTFLINGHSYTVKMQDRFDLLLKELGMSALAGSKMTDIKAPMPGLVLEVLAKEGQELSKGDEVLVLEAMKMENVLKAPGDGVVKSISVKQGDAVEKNQVMVVLE